MSVVSERKLLYSAAIRFENKELFVIKLKKSIEIQFIISFFSVVASVSTHMSHFFNLRHKSENCHGCLVSLFAIMK